MLDKNQSSVPISSVEADLYHRDPYLMLDEVESCTEKEVTATKRLTGEEYFFKGHFPNSPVLPGAMMQEMTTQAAGVLIARFFNPMGKSYDTNNFDPNRPALGVLSRVKEAKFKSFARPDDNLIIKAVLIENLKDFFEFKGQVIKKTESGDKVIMVNRFCLTNIPSSLLLEDQ